MTEDDFIILDATMNHAEILFAWRNDPETIRMSKDDREVTWERHVYWLYWKIRKMKEDSHHNQIGMMKMAGDGPMVGTFRVEDGVLSYTIAPGFRRRGLGTIMLKNIRRMYGRLICEIKAENTASIKAARNAGHIVILVE